MDRSDTQALPYSFCNPPVLTPQSADTMSAPSPAPSQLPPEPPSPSAPPTQSHSAITHASNLEILSLFSRPGPNRPALPAEIICQILADPSRWIQSGEVVLEKPMSVRSFTSTKHSTIVLRSPPLTSRSIRLLRKAVFTFKSRDQGWSSYAEHYGTYENSWTWFDACVGRLTPGSDTRTDQEGTRTNSGNTREDMPYSVNDDSGGSSSEPVEESPRRKRWTSKAQEMLQANRHASRVAESYRVELEAGKGILEDLKEGDEIALVACAIYSGWVNNVEEASLELWEEDDLTADGSDTV